MNSHDTMDIASLLEVQVNEEQPTTAVEGDGVEKSSEPAIRKPSECISEDERHYYKLVFGSDIAKVRFRKIHCTACDVHIGSAPSEAHNMHEHPVLKTLLCTACREFYGDGSFEQGDDATDMFCRWCANGGNLYCCSYCSNTFCQKCIRINFDAEVRKQIEADEKWKCFVCHPAPLYTHRALCWAILQHVKTVSRILQADHSQSPKEMLARMELDDTTCCPGRKAKRKRRNTATSSSDDDDDDGSTTSRSSSRSRKRASKRKKTQTKDAESPNGRYVTIAPRRPKVDDDDITSLLNPEQTMIEGDNDSVIIPGADAPPRPIPDHIFKNNTVSLHPIPTQSLLQRPVTRGGKMMIPIRPLRRIDMLPPGTTPQVITRLTGLPGRPAAPMVTIPNRPLIIPTPGGATPTAAQRKSYPTLRIDRNNPKLQSLSSPSVIDLESDSDEPTVVDGASNSSKPDQPESTVEKSNTAEPTTYPRLTVRKFDQTISNPMKAIDEVLRKLRTRLKAEMKTFDSPQEGNEINSARVKLKIINRNISKTVSELALLNNTMVRQYKPWKTSCITGEPLEDSTGKIRLRKGEPSHKIIPLELECEPDSESEEDDEAEEEEEAEEHVNIDYSNKVAAFSEKETVDRGCNTAQVREDKATQVYDVIPEDCEHDIGYSLLMRADFDRKQNKETFKPVIIYDKFFGKYEEQFIFYLQHREDEANADDEKENASPVEKSLKEIIDADLSEQTRREKIFEKISDDSDEIHKDSEARKDDSKEVFSRKADEVKDLCDELEKLTEETDPHREATKNTLKDENTKQSTGEDFKGDSDVGMVDAGKADRAPATSGGPGDTGAKEISLSQEARNEETVIAVRALIEDETHEDETFKETWKNNEDDDECTILD